MVVGMLATVVAGGMVAAAWAFISPTGFVFAWVTHFILMAWASVIVAPGIEIPDYRWLRVRSWEPPIYVALGTRLFGKLLDIIGWNRMISKERGFDTTRQGLGELDQHTRRSEISHTICLLITVVLAFCVLAAGSWTGSLWLLGLGIPLHLYPAFLQRILRARIQTVKGKL